MKNNKKKNRRMNVINMMAVSALLLSIPVSTASAKGVDTVNVVDKKEKLIINFIDNASEKGKVQIKSEGKVKKNFEHINAISMEIDSGKVELLKKNPNVKSIEPDIKVHIAQSIGYGQERVNAPKSWASGLTGKGTKVGVIDSGVSTHPDLIVSGGQSFVGYTNSYADDNGHGTHVSGIISAENNEIGVVGVAPDSDIFALKALDQDGSGYLSDIIEAIDWSITNQMDVINMSLGTKTASSALESAVNTAYQNGILVVAAAGNESTSVSYPAKYSSVIAVSATDENNELAYFSNFGPEVEISAPGTNILSTSSLGDYENMSGTSMATPFVAGQLALLNELDPTYTAVQLREELHKNVLDLGAAGQDKLFGYGLMQAPVKNVDTIVTPTLTEDVVSAPMTPSNFKAIKVTNRYVTLNWGSVDNATYYEITRDNVVIYKGSNLSFTDNNVSRNKTYLYKVVAGNETGISEAASITVKTK
ncbi:S8 family serine peptidase [[Brevibacterium] frigoritolerans]|nr:S8 family serine peptidase [Peribacillus frigoritolerans]